MRLDVYVTMIYILSFSKHTLCVALADLSAELVELAERELGPRFWKLGGCMGFLIAEPIKWAFSFS